MSKEIIVGFENNKKWRFDSYGIGELTANKWRLLSDLKMINNGDLTPIEWRINCNLNIINSGD